MTQSARPEGYAWLSPYLTVQDADSAMKFYQKAFNFEKKETVLGQDGTTWHAELKYKDQVIMLGKQGAYKSTIKSPTSSGVESPITLYLYCEDVDKFHAHAIAHGAVSLGEPEKMFWGDRMCRLKDPDGYVWCFATAA